MKGTSERGAALVALACPVLAPLAVVLGIGATLLGHSWALFLGGLIGILLLRAAAPHAESFEKQTGTPGHEYALLTPAYLRFHADRLGIGWHIVAVASWMSVAALVGFFAFLCIHAIYEFAS